jgi:hypothetical protein
LKEGLKVNEKQAIAVSADGNNLNARVTKAGAVEIPTIADIEEVINGRIADVTSAIAGDGVEDPTVKKCSRCAKMGRIALHPVNQFSTIKKTGKLSSQCKVCRTEQSNAWCKEKAEHRREYHRQYRLIRGAEGRPPKSIRELAKLNSEQAVEIPAEIKGIRGLENLFVAFTNAKTEKE